MAVDYSPLILSTISQFLIRVGQRASNLNLITLPLRDGSLFIHYEYFIKSPCLALFGREMAADVYVCLHMFWTLQLHLLSG